MTQHSRPKETGAAPKLVKSAQPTASQSTTKSKSMKKSEMLPSDGNDNSGISPRVAFLAYN
jgi:hypothetical protein